MEVMVCSNKGQTVDGVQEAVMGRRRERQWCALDGKERWRERKDEDEDVQEKEGTVCIRQWRKRNDDELGRENGDGDSKTEHSDISQQKRMMGSDIWRERALEVIKGSDDEQQCRKRDSD